MELITTEIFFSLHRPNWISEIYCHVVVFKTKTGGTYKDPYIVSITRSMKSSQFRCPIWPAPYSVGTSSVMWGLWDPLFYLHPDCSWQENSSSTFLWWWKFRNLERNQSPAPGNSNMEKVTQKWKETLESGLTRPQGRGLGITAAFTSWSLKTPLVLLLLLRLSLRPLTGSVSPRSNNFIISFHFY